MFRIIAYGYIFKIGNNFDKKVKQNKRLNVIHCKNQSKSFSICSLKYLAGYVDPFGYFIEDEDFITSEMTMSLAPPPIKRRKPSQPLSRGYVYNSDKIPAISSKKKVDEKSHYYFPIILSTVFIGMGIMYFYTPKKLNGIPI